MEPLQEGVSPVQPGDYGRVVVVVGRSAVDGLGKPYPLLHMVYRGA